MQVFVEKYAEDVLGIKVIGSTRRGEGGLFKIDVLGVDAENTPFVIECKWDQVGSGAIRQLVRYKTLLIENWPVFEKRVSEIRGRALIVANREPVLVAIGYRYSPSAVALSEAESVVCLTYSYHPATLTVDALEQRRPGKVSIQHVQQMPSCHPPVSKKHISLEKLERLTPELRKAFWDMDDKLCRLGPKVTVRHGKTVRYRGPQGEFAKAKIGPKSSPESIQWRYGKSDIIELRAEGDRGKILELLRKAYMDANAREKL